jgi:glutamyl-tRNA reductase
VELLVVGISHRTAPVGLLEGLAVPPADTPALLSALLALSSVDESIVLSTCNRVEIYAGVSAPHAMDEIGQLLAARAGVDSATLAGHLYVRYDDEAVRHTFRVAAGLDSMVVGEPQILGQLRDAYAAATEHAAVGPALHELMQQAMRTGKRAHAETGIDAAGRSVVTAALDLGSTRAGATIAGARALVVGTGALAALALSTLRRAGAARLTVAGRHPGRTARLAASHGAAPVPMTALPDELANADVVICATASPEYVLTATDLPCTGPLLILDLAVPRDVDPGVVAVPGVTLIDIASLGDALAATSGTDVAASGFAVRASTARTPASALVSAALSARSTPTNSPTRPAPRARSGCRPSNRKG